MEGVNFLNIQTELSSRGYQIKRQIPGSRNGLLIVEKENKEYVAKFSPSPDSEWVQNEAKILQQLSHPNIISFVDCFVLLQNQPVSVFCLIVEKAEGSSVYSLTLEKGRLSEAEVQRICKQLVSTLAYLHKRRLIHRDLKPENVIWDPKRKQMKLIDFEFCCGLWVKQMGPFVLRKHQIARGTLEYCPPEALRAANGRGTGYGGPSADLWSLGVSIFEMLTGSYPLSPTTLSFLLSTDVQRRKCWSVPKVKGLTVDGQDFLERLLQAEPEKRISVKKMLEHPWLKHVQ